MIDKGAKLNVRNQWGMTELHTAIWRGNIHVAAYLLDQGSDPLIKTNEGWTAMHYAFRSGHVKVGRQAGRTPAGPVCWKKGTDAESLFNRILFRRSD